MPHMPRIIASDEELGKKDDNYRPSTQSSWLGRATVRLRRKRIFAFLIGAVLVYLFIHNRPTDLTPIDRPDRQVPIQHGAGAAADSANRADRSPQKAPNHVPEPSGETPRPSALEGAVSGEEEHYYAGPIRFYHLATSLHAISRTLGHMPMNRNVLFAASSLKSVANLIPLACEMARQEKNFVHVALLGRAAFAMHEVLEMNGVDTEECRVHFHDGRADYSEYSTDVRAEVAVAGALNHINTYMHPQVLIMDDSAVEDGFFTRSVRGKMSELGRPVIEIPKGRYLDFFWMTRLDSGSLSAWHRPSIHLLIQVQPGSSGSLLRLLKSLFDADYAGTKPPRLTIDLPPHIDGFAADFLRTFSWPPGSDDTISKPNTMMLHRRIPTSHSSTEANAVRFFESFYPADPADDHVLILSPQSEVSPLYYQYTLYHLLRHKYSVYEPLDNDRLLGLSLVAATSYLNGSTPFTSPINNDMLRTKYKKQDDDVANKAPAPFLWAAPNADAVLVFGSKWTEMHHYLSNRLRSTHAQKSTKKRAKLIAETQPGWMEFVLELMRARGWVLAFPARSEGVQWAAVHGDLYSIPEEFRAIATTKEDDPATAPGMDLQEPFLLGEDVPQLAPRKETHPVGMSQPLHILLPFEGDLPELAHMPVLKYTGEKTDRDELDTEAENYSEHIRVEVGGCDAKEAKRARKVAPGRTGDLFCFEDEPRSYIADEEEAMEVIEAETRDNEDEKEADDKEKSAELQEAGAAIVKPNPATTTSAAVVGAAAAAARKTTSDVTAMSVSHIAAGKAAVPTPARQALDSIQGDDAGEYGQEDDEDGKEP